MAVEHVEAMGARIKQRRLELGLSRAAVARQMKGKVDGNAIYRWEKGKHEPNPSTREDLARVLKVQPTYFLMDAPGKSETPDLSRNGQPSQLDRIEHKLDRVIALLDDELEAAPPGFVPELEPELRPPSSTRSPAEQTPDQPRKTRANPKRRTA